MLFVPWSSGPRPPVDRGQGGSSQGGTLHRLPPPTSSYLLPSLAASCLLPLACSVRWRGSGRRWTLPPCWRSSSPTCRGSARRWVRLLSIMTLFQVAFSIFTNGKQTLGLNLSERFAITNKALNIMEVN